MRGLAHITGDGFLTCCGSRPTWATGSTTPLPVPPVFGLVAERGGVEHAELYEVFNMGCGFCVVVPAATPTRPWSCSPATTRARP